MQVERGGWVRRFHAAPDRPVRLVLLPHAGGSASYFFPFSRDLSAAADVLSIQYPGRQDRLGEPCIDDATRLADALTEALLPWLDRPFVLFGHSLGATVAFEVARRLERDAGLVPRRLIVSGRRAPADVRDSGVHRRDDEGLLAELAEMSGTDSTVLTDPDLLDMILPVLRSDYRAAETYVYRPGPPLSCPILAMAADSDPRVSVEDVDRWRRYTTAGFELEVFPGGHFYLADERPGVVAAITRRLGEA
ncbi:MAG TPA: alpha/beta fold hydrolase [Actinophytocola sp.]|uniref:thioesterase II family protein n=1 Tax=Actinophytocola sp. TaxID=1872138 RepID=UPI002DDDB2B7|nr:alpha/beta fold hydrolase [Actinophytocola sp.]HEV2780663.1 alpha/beta fold hydrolase [Actinophytocola sp.]